MRCKCEGQFELVGKRQYLARLGWSRSSVLPPSRRDILPAGSAPIRSSLLSGLANKSLCYYRGSSVFIHSGSDRRGCLLDSSCSSGGASRPDWEQAFRPARASPPNACSIMTPGVAYAFLCPTKGAQASLIQGSGIHSARQQSIIYLSHSISLQCQG